MFSYVYLCLSWNLITIIIWNKTRLHYADFAEIIYNTHRLLSVGFTHQSHMNFWFNIHRPCFLSRYWLIIDVGLPLPWCSGDERLKGETINSICLHTCVSAMINHPRQHHHDKNCRHDKNCHELSHFYKVSNI